MNPTFTPADFITFIALSCIRSSVNKPMIGINKLIINKIIDVVESLRDLPNLYNANIWSTDAAKYTNILTNGSPAEARDKLAAIAARRDHKSNLWYLATSWSSTRDKDIFMVDSLQIIEEEINRKSQYVFKVVENKIFYFWLTKTIALYQLSSSDRFIHYFNLDSTIS